MRPGSTVKLTPSSATTVSKRLCRPSTTRLIWCQGSRSPRIPPQRRRQLLHGVKLGMARVTRRGRSQGRIGGIGGIGGTSTGGSIGGTSTMSPGATGGGWGPRSGPGWGPAWRLAPVEPPRTGGRRWRGCRRLRSRRVRGARFGVICRCWRTGVSGDDIGKVKRVVRVDGAPVGEERPRLPAGRAERWHPEPYDQPRDGDGGDSGNHRTTWRLAAPLPQPPQTARREAVEEDDDPGRSETEQQDAEQGGCHAEGIAGAPCGPEGLDLAQERVPGGGEDARRAADHVHGQDQARRGAVSRM